MRTAGGSDAESAPLTVAAVARELGVAAATLRTWDRRYDLGPSAHQAGSHRRYSPHDVARLQLMRRLTLRGVAPADAARIAKADADPADDGEHTPPQESHPPAGQAVEAAAGEPAAEEPLLIDPLSLAAAAVEADIERLGRIIRKAVRAHGLVGAWQEVAAPARELIAAEHHRPLQRPGADPLAVLEVAVMLAARDIAVEHKTDGQAPVLLRAAAGAQLEAHVVGGALAEHDVAAAVVAPETAADGVELVDGERVQQLRVLAVLGRPPDAEELVSRASQRGDVEIYLMGNDVPELWLPRVHRVRTLGAAVAEIAASIRADDT